jgi:hypothetical protein
LFKLSDTCISKDLYASLCISYSYHLLAFPWKKSHATQYCRLLVHYVLHALAADPRSNDDNTREHVTAAKFEILTANK